MRRERTEMAVKGIIFRTIEFPDSSFVVYRLLLNLAKFD